MCFHDIIKIYERSERVKVSGWKIFQIIQFIIFAGVSIFLFVRQVDGSGAENTQQLNEYLSDTEREYFINKENKPGNEVSSEVTEIINDSAQRNTTPTDDQISEAELNARERDTLEFDEEERR